MPKFTVGALLDLRSIVNCALTGTFGNGNSYIAPTKGFIHRPTKVTVGNKIIGGETIDDVSLPPIRPRRLIR
jgi:hypothetical protein